jgi:hypothetical protein
LLSLLPGKGEIHLCQNLLRDARFLAFQLAADRVTAAEIREQGCVECGGALHSANFTRKPRGGPAGLAPGADVRFSLCCAEDGCRTRHTPPSLRFVGRKVYLGAVVVIVSAMRHGATSERMSKLRELVGVSRRTVERFRSDELLPLGSRMRVRLTLDRATPEELADTLRHAMAKAGAAKLMTPELVATLCDHATGNRRALMNMAGELLAAAAQRDLRHLDEKLFLETFAPQAPPEAKVAGRRR